MAWHPVRGSSLAGFIGFTDWPSCTYKSIRRKHTETYIFDEERSSPYCSVVHPRRTTQSFTLPACLPWRRFSDISLRAVERSDFSLSISPWSVTRLRARLSLPPARHAIGFAPLCVTHVSCWRKRFTLSFSPCSVTAVEFLDSLSRAFQPRDQTSTASLSRPSTRRLSERSFQN